MKKYLFFVLILVLSLSACSKENTDLQITDKDMVSDKQQETNITTTPSQEGEAGKDSVDVSAYEKCRVLGNYDTKAIEIGRKNEEWNYNFYPSKTGSTDHVEIFQYLGTNSSVVIPETIDGAPVTVVVATGDGFAPNMNMEDITDIQFPNTLYFIAADIFDKTTWYQKQPDGLVYAGNVLYKYKGELQEEASLTLDSKTLGIAGYAFKNCKNLKELIMPDSVILIGNGAFQECTSLEKLQMSKTILTINAFVFKGCNALKELQIPASVYELNSKTFSDSKIEKIYFDGSKELWERLCSRAKIKSYPSVEFGE